MTSCGYIAGINDYDDGTKSREELLKDTFRIEYHETHFQELHKAIVLVLDLYHNIYIYVSIFKSIYN